MASKTFAIHAELAAFEAKMKALVDKREAHLAKARDGLGALVITSGLSNGLEDNRLFGALLWLKRQLQANPKLGEECDRLSATFSSKSRPAKKDTPEQRAGKAAPAVPGKPDRRSDAGPDDLLARGAAE